MMYFLSKLCRPEIFQGKKKKLNYFEGWYYKIIDDKMENAYAVIPGVSYGKNLKDAHAFIQVLDSYNKVNYVPYDISTFKFNENKFEIKIGDNYFSRDKMRLNINSKDIQMKGQLLFNNIITFPKTLFCPGIMGPFSYVPFMECYHGVVNINHDIVGQLNISGNNVDFSRGYGYIEKDWGKSFPEGWVWLQSNHFKKEDVTLMFSEAKIPWLGKSFQGFLSLLRIKEEIYIFASYTFAKIIKLDYSDNKLEVIVEDRKYRMKMKVNHSPGGALKAPKNGQMNRVIVESINAVVKVKLSDRKGNIIFEGIGTNTGLEIVKE